MKKHLIISIALLFATSLFSSILLSTSSAAAFKVYPGAKLDDRATRDTNGPGSISKKKVYISNDSLDKVAAFYKGIAKEYVMPGTSQKGPQARFFIFDNGKDLSDSKHWIKVQRPALGLYKEDIKTMKMRDITVIILVER